MRYSMLVATVLVMLICGPVAAEELTPFRGERTLTVMTQNVYHGVNAELYGVATATDFRDLLIKVAAVFNGYHTRNFPERAAALAAEIEASRPDLIGLQEAVLVRTQAPADGAATPAGTVALDYVQLLLDALAARGLAYEVIGTSFGCGTRSCPARSASTFAIPIAR